MTRDERHRWLFAHMDGRIIHFTQKGMPFRVMAPNAVFGGVVHIGDCKCKIRIVHDSSQVKGRRYLVRFPHTEYNKTLPLDQTTLVGFMELKGNWREGTGKCIFHPVNT